MYGSTGEPPQGNDGGTPSFIVPGLAIVADLLAVVGVFVVGSGVEGLQMVAVTFGAVSIIAAAGYMVIYRAKPQPKYGRALAVLLVGALAFVIGLVNPGNAEPRKDDGRELGAPTTSLTSTTPEPTPTTTTTADSTTVTPNSSTTSLSTRPSTSSPPELPTYFSDLQPTRQEPLGFNTGVAKIGRETYNHSTFLYCKGLNEPSRYAWDLSSYDSITTTFGMQNDAPGGDWLKLEIRITGDNGRALHPPFFVQIGSPVTLTVPLNKSITFNVQCGGVSQANGHSTGSSVLAVGDGTFA